MEHDQAHSPEDAFPVTEADDHVDAAPHDETPESSENSEAHKAVFYFMVEVQHDGCVVLRTSELPATPPEVDRYATSADIISTCQKIATEMNNGVIIDSVANVLQSMMSSQMATPATQADTLRLALAERGIELSIKDPHA